MTDRRRKNPFDVEVDQPPAEGMRVDHPVDGFPYDERDVHPQRNVAARISRISVKIALLIAGTLAAAGYYYFRGRIFSSSDHPRPVFQLPYCDFSFQPPRTFFATCDGNYDGLPDLIFGPVDERASSGQSGALTADVRVGKGDKSYICPVEVAFPATWQPSQGTGTQNSTHYGRQDDIDCFESGDMLAWRSVAR